MSTLHVVILKLFFTEGASKSMVYAFSLQGDAEGYAALWNQKVEHARILKEALEVKMMEWDTEHPYPSDAYAVYEAAKQAAWDASFEKLYAEQPTYISADQAYNLFEARSEAHDKIMAEWAEANKELHWGKVQDAWRTAYFNHRNSLPECVTYLEARLTLLKQFPWCEHYEPCDIQFCVETCELVG